MFPLPYDNTSVLNREKLVTLCFCAEFPNLKHKYLTTKKLKTLHVLLFQFILLGKYQMCTLVLHELPWLLVVLG